MSKRRVKTISRYQLLSRGRVKRRGQGNMNLNEARYSLELDSQVAAGTLTRYWFEPFSLRLSNPPKGQPARYTPDFLLLYPDGRTVVIELKGGGVVNEASIVRVKCAAEQYPLWEFLLVRPVKGKWLTLEV